jgi:hypothetical protein
VFPRKLQSLAPQEEENGCPVYDKQVASKVHLPVVRVSTRRVHAGRKRRLSREGLNRPTNDSETLQKIVLATASIYRQACLLIAVFLFYQMIYERLINLWIYTVS